MDTQCMINIKKSGTDYRAYEQQVRSMDAHM